MINAKALFSVCHESGWRCVYLFLQSRKQDFYLTMEQGSTGNFHLFIKAADAPRLSAFFTASAPGQVVKWKPARFIWNRLSLVKSKKPGEIHLRILYVTPISLRFTSAPFPVEKLVQLGLAWQALLVSPQEQA
ncbi:hypothetical protein [Pseudomonas sp. B22129]|uniref:hypothetical protein n=1 Tax=Pseudomonas sp. B22129 TaxID=3235111 RepID=UPI0037836D04